jgi:hypothetical protein
MNIAKFDACPVYSPSWGALVVAMICMVVSSSALAARFFVAPIVIPPGTHRIALPNVHTPALQTGPLRGRALAPLDSPFASPPSSLARLLQGKATVTLGADSMTLEDALDKGLIRLSPTKEGVPLGSALQLSRSATTEGLENLDPQRRPMTIQVTEPVALGSLVTSSIGKPVRQMDVSRASAISNRSVGNLEFRETWRALDTLRRAGYGEAGEPDPAFAVALGRFQVENGLSLSAELDRPTLDALHQHRKIANFLNASATASNDMYHVMHVTRAVDPLKSRYYRVQVGDAAARWVNTNAELAAQIDALSTQWGASNVYVMVDGLVFERDLAALQTSMALRRSSIHANVLLIGEPASELIRRGRSLNLDRLFKPVTNTGEVLLHSEITRGLDGRYRATADLPVGDTTLRVTLKDSRWLFVRRFLATLRDLFSNSSDYTNLSYLALIQKARLDTAQALGRPMSEVDLEFQVNLEGSQLAETTSETVAALAP